MNTRIFIPSIVPIPIRDKILVDLVNKGKDWAITHGASIRQRNNYSEDSINFAPFVLFPSVMTREHFLRAVGLQTLFQELMYNVAYDKEFLTKCLENTIQVDSFTRKLFEIYQTLQKEGETQPITLGLFRCDYMMESSSGVKHDVIQDSKEFSKCNWKLIEVNTIAAGFGWLGPVSRLMQSYILEEMNFHDKLHKLPENNALSGLCEGILEAWKIYGNSKGSILIVVEDVTYNISDQRFHEYKLKELNPTITIRRLSLTQVYHNVTLNESKELILDNEVISVVYYRSGYEPKQYHSENEWTARLLIERSAAIKCPNIQIHLAGTKKVQQELAKPGILERFLNDPISIKSIREAFVEIYGLEFDETGNNAVNLALENPEKYVLKPQREGGGNNIYGLEVKTVMEKMKESRERTAWILMERIFPPITKGYMIRSGSTTPPPVSEMVSEFGIFGVIIGNGNKILSNRQVGHMLRTKFATANEGGVTVGLGALDSPYIYD